MNAYADTVRLRHDWRLDAGNPAPAPHRGFPRSRAVGMALAAGLALAVVAGAWFRETGGLDRDPAFGRIHALLESSAHHGPLLPGTAGAAYDPQPLTRSRGLDSAGTAGVRALLKDLQEEQDHGPSAALEIAGYLALDDLAMADIRARRELDAGGDDPDLWLVAGVLAYRQSRLEDARAFFLRTLNERPGDPEARFNLALVQSETGGTGRARVIFEELAEREDLPLVRHRAQRELARLRDLQPVD